MKYKPTLSILFLSLALLAGCEVGVEQPAVTEATTDDAQAQVAQSATPNHAIPRGRLSFIEGYEKGYEQGKIEGKPMMIFFTAEWCHYCHQMAEEAFTDDQVVSLSRDFVCILVDYDAEPAICRQFNVQGCPTIQFLSPRGLPLKRIVGKKPGHVLVMEMQAALQNVARLAEAEQEVTPR